MHRVTSLRGGGINGTNGNLDSADGGRLSENPAESVIWNAPRPGCEETKAAAAHLRGGCSLKSPVVHWQSRRLRPACANTSD